MVVRTLPLVLLLLGTTSVVSAGGFSNLDVGTHRCSMMAVVAAGQDATMVYHNPANLVQIQDELVQASLNSILIGTEIRLRYPDDTMSENLEPSKAYGFVPFLGYVTDLDREDLAFGMALYFPNLFGASMPEEYPTRYLASDALFVTGYLTPAVGYRACDWLSLGVGLDLIYTTISMDRAFNLASLVDDDIRNYDPDYDFWFNVEGDDQVWTWHAGITLEPTDRLRLSAVYYHRADLKLEGEIDVDPPEQTGIEPFSTYSSVTMLVPAAWRLGLSYRIGRRWTLGFDYNWWKYSDYEVQKVETGLGSELGIDLDLSAVKDYTNSKNMGIGVSFQATRRLQLLAGLQRDWTPAPDRTYTIDNPNLSYWGFGLGAKMQVGRNLGAELSYNHQDYERVNIRTSETWPPTNGIGDGTWDAVGLSLLWKL